MAVVERWPLWRGAVSGGSTVTKSICHYTEFYTTRQNYQKLCITIIQLYSVIQKYKQLYDVTHSYTKL